MTRRTNASIRWTLRCSARSRSAESGTSGVQIQGKQLGGQGNGVQGRPNVVRDEGEILFPPALECGGLGSRKSFHRRSDRIVDDMIDDPAFGCTEPDVRRFRHVMHGSAEGVVFEHDFLDVETVGQPLPAMRDGAARAAARDLFIVTGDRQDHFIDELGNMIAQGWPCEFGCARQFAHAGLPAGKERGFPLLKHHGEH